MSEINVTFTLTDAELDAVAGGQASATLDLSGGVSAAGPTSAMVSATGLGATALTVGGLSPSNSASVTGTIMAASA